MNDQDTEQAILATNPKAPRLTLGDINATIVSEDYYQFPGTTVTVCLLRLKNGFSVTGESAAISVENFSADIGRAIARTNAREKIWVLEGYRLKQEISVGLRS